MLLVSRIQQHRANHKELLRTLNAEFIAPPEMTKGVIKNILSHFSIT